MNRNKKWICILFHKKETFHFPGKNDFDNPYGLYNGCRKCDMWHKIDM